MGMFSGSTGQVARFQSFKVSNHANAKQPQRTQSYTEERHGGINIQTNPEPSVVFGLPLWFSSVYLCALCG